MPFIRFRPQKITTLIDKAVNMGTFLQNNCFLPISQKIQKILKKCFGVFLAKTQLENTPLY